MLMLMATWESPNPPDSTPQPDPEPADLWMKFVWIVLLAFAAVYAVTVVLWVVSYFRGPVVTGVLRAGGGLFLVFPSQMLVQIRRSLFGSPERPQSVIEGSRESGVGR